MLPEGKVAKGAKMPVAVKAACHEAHFTHEIKPIVAGTLWIYEPAPGKCDQAFHKSAVCPATDPEHASKLAQ